MIGITEKVMAEGMCADYDQVFKRTRQIYDVVRNAKTIHVTSAKGSDVTATFNPNWKWVPCDGNYYKQGMWGNLPEGEIYTTPDNISGVIVADVLGDYFSAKYGVLKKPLTFVVINGYVKTVIGDDEALAREVNEYLFSTKNGNRVGEFAIGTLESLKRLSGNLLQDEKMPGLHIAFGNTYYEHTGADWDALTHVDVIPVRCTISVDGRTIMRDGKFTI